jgi:hypothetical protein
MQICIGAFVLLYVSFLGLLKKQLLLLVLGITSCSILSDDNCKYNDYTETVNLDTMGVWKSVTKVEVISFKSFAYEDTDIESVLREDTFTVEPLERKELSKRQTRKLKHILFSYMPQEGCEGYGIGYDCIFNPHQAILFYDDANKIVAHIEVCFSCYQYEVYGNLGSWATCHEFYERIKSLFSKAGITEYMEIGKEYED